MTYAEAVNAWAEMPDEQLEEVPFWDQIVALKERLAALEAQTKPSVVPRPQTMTELLQATGSLPTPEPEPPSLTASVWVAIAVATKAIVVQNRRDVPATGPMGQGGGRLSIFAQGPPVTQESFAAEVIAVTTDRETCEAAVQAHKAKNADCEYKVGEHPVGWTAGAPSGAPDLVVNDCIGGCGTKITGGMTLCNPCRTARFAAVREVDPGDETPTIRNTYTPPQDRTGVGRGM